MEFNTVKKCLVLNGSSMGSPVSERFEVRFARSADIDLVDGGEGDQFDGVNFDLALGNTVTTALFHFWPFPQPERHGDVTGQHMGPQLPAELHDATLRQSTAPLNRDKASWSWAAETVAVLRR
jgi:hypothetical protein